MSFYTDLMKEATGVTDAETITEIEDVMRLEAGTLDGLTRAAFIKLAKKAYKVVLQLKEEGVM